MAQADFSSLWHERYQINFQRYLNLAMRHGYIQVSQHLTDKLASLTPAQCQEAAQAYQLDAALYPEGQLQAEICRLAQEDAALLPASLDAGVYLLTDTGARFVRGHQYLLLMDQYYFPDVINFKKLEVIRKKQPHLEPWQCLVILIDEGLDQSELYHNSMLSLLLLKHKVKLYRHLGRHEEGLLCLQEVLFYELRHAATLNLNTQIVPDLKRLTSYEAQELHFFLEQLNLPLEDFLLRFGDWLQERELPERGFTRPEMISSIMFAYLEDFNSLRNLCLNIQNRNQN
ncbi:hypothetical protein ACFQ5M_06900 [Agrilactobacillus yilanensis]|uniref:Uncharacterized protein n=1 Tax=Agrilactobacillus yilanensis TaxID=2485997 RepID=A0ABW4J818_9LACO|nr:hypothetical protein [Agrilactobacillus yilanensis]